MSMGIYHIKNVASYGVWIHEKIIHANILVIIFCICYTYVELMHTYYVCSLLPIPQNPIWIPRKSSFQWWIGRFPLFFVWLMMLLFGIRIARCAFLYFELYFNACITTTCFVAWRARMIPLFHLQATFHTVLVVLSLPMTTIFVINIPHPYS